MGRAVSNSSGALEFTDPLTGALYEQLRTQAERHLRQRFGRAAAGLTWQPTALVNETLLRMIRQHHRYDSQGHFFALATTVMRRVIVDYVRERMAQKRSGGRVRVNFDPERHSPLAPSEDSVLDIEALFLAIEHLAESHPRRGGVAWMRLAFGFTIPQIAESFEVSRASVERDWRFAKAWIRCELQAQAGLLSSPASGAS